MQIDKTSIKNSIQYFIENGAKNVFNFLFENSTSIIILNPVTMLFKFLMLVFIIKPARKNVHINKTNNINPNIFELFAKIIKAIKL